MTTILTKRRVGAIASAALLLAVLGTKVAPLARAQSHEPVTVRKTLTIEEKKINILGVPMTSWTFNGTVPGPTMRLHVGDTLEVELNNTHNVPHAFHTHFENYPLAFDGSSMTAPLPVVPHQEDDVLGTVGGKVPGVGNAPGPHVGHNPIGPYDPRTDSDVARPAQSYTYRYKMTAVGTFWYHCHVMEATDHIEKGLFGFVIVYPEGWTFNELPADALNGNTKAEVTNAKGEKMVEDVVIISERNPAEDSLVGLAAQGGVLGGPIKVANFRAWNDPYTIGPVQSGKKMLLHVGNIGESSHTWHLHGTHFYQLWQSWHPEDGAPVWTQGSIDPVPFTPITQQMHAMDISPGEIFPTVFTAGQPGWWFAHDHVVPDAYLGMVPWLHIVP